MVQDSWFLIQDAKYLVHSREADEASHHYNALMGVLNDFKTVRYQAWVDALHALDSSNLQGRLENPLMKRAANADDMVGGQSILSKSKDNLLECNFDQSLLALFTEVHYWEKFMGDFAIPYVAHDICNQREKVGGATYY